MPDASAVRSLRIGVLGAARITPQAVIEPARRSARASVVAVAARDVPRAQRFAADHGIGRVEPTYDALLESPEVDAVYIALPAALHARWTLRALRAGKHVLCEKPFAANALEAEQMVAAAIAAKRVLLEAVHYRFHPLAERVRALVSSGEIGRIRTIQGEFDAAIDPADIRHQLALGGGALMDLGCYPVHWARLCAGAEPEVISAEAICAAAGVDLTMNAELALPDGARARVSCSMALGAGRRNSLHVRGDQGELTVDNLLAPHQGHEVRIHGTRGPRSERVPGKTTYDHQLEAFVAAVVDGGPQLTGGADAIGTMRVIDAIYRAAGLAPRGGRAPSASQPELRV